MTYQLRAYQSELLDRVSQSWDADNRRVMLQLPAVERASALLTRLSAIGAKTPNRSLADVSATSRVQARVGLASVPRTGN